MIEALGTTLMLAELVDEFLSGPLELWCCEIEKPEADSLIGAIQIATLSIDHRGRRHPHQWRIPLSVLERLRDALIGRAEEIRTKTSFSSLHALVVAECLGIRGAGELLAYDVAFRIGLYLGFEPQKVYLHAGTRTGARRLGLNGAAVSLSELPRELQRLQPCQVENFLCLYANKL
ncbi:hypothetical protein [Neoaquamicrobium sediminum]|uniref:Uncharacterized protein n=1 Tax=Neoaquamicrobium sediminum TaxID=1849104 RepID=A0ABV3WQ18_9HYPH